MIGHENLIILFKKTVSARKFQNSIFFGEEKIGKKLFALALANYLENGKFNDSKSILSDMVLVDYPRRSLGVDLVRELKEFLGKKPFFSPYRLAIVNDAQFLTVEAQNALLKTAEESNDSARIILIARDVELLLPTLVSRFQKFYFSPLNGEEMKEFAKTAFGLTGEKAEVIIKKSFGQPGRAAAFLEKKKNPASEIIGMASLERKAFIKELVAKDDFNMGQFLDDLVSCLAADIAKHHFFIKKILQLRRQANLNLNPRLQLENLFS